MSDSANNTSVHETARNLHNIMDTLRQGVASNTFKALLGTTPNNEPIFVFEWPECPMYGTATVYFGPKDLENYRNASHPWEHMRTQVGVEAPPTHEDYSCSSHEIERTMQALGKGKIICPISGNENVRLYDHVYCVSASSDAAMKLLYCSDVARWAVSFRMSSSVGVAVTDVQRKL